MNKKEKVVFIVITFIVLISCYLFLENDKEKALNKRHNLTFVLGEEIKKRYPDRKILLLANPFKKHSFSDFDSEGIEGLKDAFGGSTEIQVAYPEIYPQFQNNPGSAILPMDTKTPLSYMVNPVSIDNLISEFPNHTILVSLIGIPFGIQNTKLWASPKHSVALIEPDMRIIGNENSARKSFVGGKIILACVTNGKDILTIDSNNINNILANKKYLLGY